MRPLRRLVSFRGDLDREQILERTGLQVQRSAQVNVLVYSTILYCSSGDAEGDPEPSCDDAPRMVATEYA